MNTLVIIGNGFDLAHSFPTSFNSFIKSNENYANKYFEFKGDDWNQVETNYADLLCDISNNRDYVDIEDVMHEQLENVYNDKYGIIETNKITIDTYDEETSKLASCIDLLYEFENDFTEYLKKICNTENIAKTTPKMKVNELIKDASWIINFNYTDVVEETYLLSNVTHIHGSLKDNDISIGSGPLLNMIEEKIDTQDPSEMECKDKYDFQEKMWYYEEDSAGNLYKREDVQDLYLTIKNELENKENLLYQLVEEKDKDTLASRTKVKNKLNHSHFDKVFILGHSLGEADYSVFDAINKDASFICYYYKEKERPNMEKTLKRLNVKYELIPTKNLYF